MPTLPTHAEQQLTANVILEKVAKAFGVQVSDIEGRSRRADIQAARNAACYWLQHSGMSLKAIGVKLGGRDHTTIMSNIRTAKGCARTSITFRNKLRQCGWQEW